MFEFIAIVIAVFFLPVLLVEFGWVKGNYRLVLFFLVTFSLSVYAFMYQNAVLPSVEFGTRIEVIMLYLYAALVGVGGICLYAMVVGRTFWWQVFNEAPHFVYGINIVISLSQQLLFFIYLLPMAVGLLGVVGGVAVTVACFTWLHIVYPKDSINLPLAFGGSVLFVIVHLISSNLLLAVLLHTVLNAVALGYGFFTRVGNHPEVS